MNTSTERRIAVIGLGSMGGAMAATLHNAGWKVTGFDPSETARTAAEDAGIATTASVEDLAGTPYAVLSLPAASVVESTVPQLLASPGTVAIIDTTTSEPATSKQMAELAEAHGAAFVDAPVSGGRDGAATGTLERLRRGNRCGPCRRRTRSAGTHRRQVQPHRRARQRQRRQAPQQRPGGGQPGLGRGGTGGRQGLRHRSGQGGSKHQRSLRRQQSLREHVSQLGALRNPRFRLFAGAHGTRRRPRRRRRRPDRRKPGAAGRRRQPVAGSAGRPRTARGFHRDRADRRPGHHPRRRPRQYTDTTAVA
jgi:hypothetical protein